MSAIRSEVAAGSRSRRRMIDVAAHEPPFDEGHDAYLEDEHLLAGLQAAGQGDDVVVVAVALAR